MTFAAEMKVLPVLASLVAGILLGRLWFARWAFGPAWLASIGKAEVDLRQELRVRAYATVIVANTATYALLGALLRATGGAGLVDGLLLGLACGAAFVAAMTFVDDAFVGRPVRSSLITGSFRIVQMTIAGAILGAWSNAPF